MKKEHELPEDDVKRAEEDIQKKTDAHIKEIDNILDAKEKEVMSV